MSGNSFGEAFRITTFGESHGVAVGVIIDGCPANFKLNLDEIQTELLRRRPGQNKLTTQRQEPEQLVVLSGLFEGKTTGAPIAMLVNNTDAKSEAYADVKELFRPGHADYTYFKKFGIRDYRGGGRSSGRETLARVIGGAVAKQLLHVRGVKVQAGVVQVGAVVCQKRDFDEVEHNIVRATDIDQVDAMVAEIREAQKYFDSIGGVVECRIQGVCVGLGEPCFDKLDAQLAKAMFSIGAVKGVEIGDGFSASILRGSQNNDAMDKSGFKTNHAGGILGGISNGNEIIIRVAFKPTPSIAQEQQTIDVNGHEVNISTTGRHDPAIFVRGVGVVEAMAALVLEDFYQRSFGDKMVLN